MDLDVTVLKAAMIKILQTSTFFPAVAEIRSIAEAMVNFYNKTTLPTPSRSADLISKAIAGGPKEAQLVAGQGQRSLMSGCGSARRRRTI